MFIIHLGRFSVASSISHCYLVCITYGNYAHTMKMNSSNAAVDDAEKYSCCTCTIYSSWSPWEDEGIVPGHIDDIYSGQSKALGYYCNHVSQSLLNSFPFLD